MMALSISNLAHTATLQGHSGCVNRLTWSTDGLLLASVSDDLKCALWEPAAGGSWRLRGSIDTGHNSNVFGVRFVLGSGNRQLVTGARDGTVRLLDAESGKWSNQLIHHHHERSPVKGVEVIPGEPHVVLSGSESGTVAAIDLRLKPASDSRLDHGALVSLRIWPSHRPYATGPSAALASLVPWPLRPGSNDVLIKSIAVSPTQPHLLAVAGNDPFVRLYDRRMLPRAGGSAGAGGGSAGGLTVAPSMPSDASYSSWRAAHKHVMLYGPPHLSCYTTGMWSLPGYGPDESGDGMGYAETRLGTPRIRTHVTHVAFSPCGNQIAAAYASRAAYTFDVANHHTWVRIGRSSAELVEYGHPEEALSQNLRFQPGASISPESVPAYQGPNMTLSDARGEATTIALVDCCSAAIRASIRRGLRNLQASDDPAKLWPPCDGTDAPRDSYEAPLCFQRARELIKQDIACGRCALNGVDAVRMQAWLHCLEAYAWFQLDAVQGPFENPDDPVAHRLLSNMLSKCLLPEQRQCRTAATLAQALAAANAAIALAPSYIPARVLQIQAWGQTGHWAEAFTHAMAIMRYLVERPPNVTPGVPDWHHANYVSLLRYLLLHATREVDSSRLDTADASPLVRTLCSADTATKTMAHIRMADMWLKRIDTRKVPWYVIPGPPTAEGLAPLPNSNASTEGEKLPQRGPRADKEEADGDAETNPDRIAARSADAASAAKEAGNKHFAARKFKQAIDSYTAALRACPRAAEHTDARAVYHANRAACYVSLKQWRDALYDCDRALMLKPDYLKARTRRITVLEKCGQLAEALQDAKVWAEELEPESTTAAAEVVRLKAGIQRAAAPSLPDFSPPVSLELPRNAPGMYIPADQQVEHGMLSARPPVSCYYGHKNEQTDIKEVAFLSGDAWAWEATASARTDAASLHSHWWKGRERQYNGDVAKRAADDSEEERAAESLTSVPRLTDGGGFRPGRQGYIACGSDDGHVYIYDRASSLLVGLLHGADRHIVNCVTPHPTQPLIATSGLESVVHLWTPVPPGSDPGMGRWGTAERPALRFKRI